MPEAGAVIRAIQDIIDEFDKRLEVAFNRFLAAFGLALIAVTLAFQIANHSLSDVDFAFAVVAGVALVSLGASIRARFYSKSVAVQAEAAREFRKAAEDLNKAAGKSSDGAADTAAKALQ